MLGLGCVDPTADWAESPRTSSSTQPPKRHPPSYPARNNAPRHQHFLRHSATRCRPWAHPSACRLTRATRRAVCSWWSLARPAAPHSPGPRGLEAVGLLQAPVILSYIVVKADGQGRKGSARQRDRWLTSTAAASPSRTPHLSALQGWQGGGKRPQQHAQWCVKVGAGSTQPLHCQRSTSYLYGTHRRPPRLAQGSASCRTQLARGCGCSCRAQRRRASRAPPHHSRRHSIHRPRY